ncbi:conserved hypothetical protein [Candidatus Terasakiella magnetica]|uniref:DUF86 domain-containing protein n=1 Tax=Candidatus Terasakiella magnetica TaxID=1867952 RepID=A0A1C3RES4_9PROT|nr:DUF86 domain-containing protein [Candidatus Terasakiella magnetica]SCA55751.1 conserved hypothetical protein [Candidatus Terasakiella magnetica]
MTKPHRHERWTFHLEQMVQAVNKIERYVAGMSRKEFLHDDKTIDAVIRNLEILGEATHHIPNKVRKTYKPVPWLALRHMRNFLAHEYFDVDPKVIWETVAKDLQGLKMSLKRLRRDAAQ